MYVQGSAGVGCMREWGSVGVYVCTWGRDMWAIAIPSAPDDPTDLVHIATGKTQDS